MRRTVIRGCLIGAFAAAAIIAPTGQALAATMVEYSTTALGSKVNTVAPTSDSLPGSDAFKALGG